MEQPRSRQMGGHSVLRHTCVSTKKVPCTAAAAGAPCTSFVSAVDEVARTPPGRIQADGPDICEQISGERAAVSGHFPDRNPPLEDLLLARRADDEQPHLRHHAHRRTHQPTAQSLHNASTHQPARA